jgi:hypothetical protein
MAHGHGPWPFTPIQHKDKKQRNLDRAGDRRAHTRTKLQLATASIFYANNEIFVATLRAAGAFGKHERAKLHENNLWADGCLAWNQTLFPVKAADQTVSRVHRASDEGRLFCPGANMRRSVRYPYADRLGHLG